MILGKMPLDHLSVSDQLDHGNRILSFDANVDLSIRGRGHIGAHRLTIDCELQSDAIAGRGVGPPGADRIKDRLPS